MRLQPFIYPKIIFLYPLKKTGKIAISSQYFKNNSTLQRIILNDIFVNNGIPINWNNIHS